MGERLRQFGLERGDELAADGGSSGGRARAADEDDAGAEGVGAPGVSSAGTLGAHEPSAAYPTAGTDHRVEESLPASA